MNQLQSNSQSIEQRFDNPSYRLLETIGSGGFGQVFKAVAVNTGQTVAIKFLTEVHTNTDPQQQRYIARFEREAQLCAHLQHPNIVRLLDKGQCNGLFYAVFEYVQGQTLRHYLQQGAMPPIEAAKVMAQLLDALAHAHQIGVIHRDLKPANIMLSRQGAQLYAKLLDFGIGTWSENASIGQHKTLTLTKETLGTPGYSAPEQLRGEPPTHKTDIYVWGLVLLECLTGAPAISGSSLAAIFHRQLSQDNVPLPSPIVGHPLADFLRRVLHKDPLHRAGDAQALYHQFSGINLATLVGDLAPKTKDTVSALDAQTQITAQTQNLRPSHQLSLSTERRQVSILCLELTIAAHGNSPADEEVADALHRDQLAQCCDIAIGFGAFHSGTLANNTLFYFGYPYAGDNDTRLSIRAALEIYSTMRRRSALLERSQGIRLSLRASIHCAKMTLYPDKAPTGIAANMAMNIVKLARPSQILCAAQNAELLSRYAEFEPAGKSLVDYAGNTQALFALVAERQHEALNFIRPHLHNQQLIGRDKPLRQLQLWLESEKTLPYLHLHGDAGVGKSRLLAELGKQTNSHAQAYLQCLPEYKNSALYALLTWLKTQLAQQGSKETIITKLAERFNQTEALESIRLALLCSWLDLPLVAGANFADVEYKTQQQLLFESLYRVLPCAFKTTQPMLLIIEDIHWADPVTLSFIHFLASQDSFTKQQSAIITSARLPLEQFELSVQATELLLDKLSSKATRQLINTLFNNKPLSPRLMDFLLSRCDGVALFIEAMVEMLKHRKQVAYFNGQFDFVDVTAKAQIPLNLQQLLQYKLDCLTYAKEIVQYAAAIGRTFDMALLQAITITDDQQLQVALNELIESDIIVLKRGVKTDNYFFRHALFADAALSTLTQKNSRALHQRLAQTMEHSFTKRAHSAPHRVGHYWAKADSPSQSARWYCKAGRKAHSNYANDETISHYQAALAQLERLSQRSYEQQALYIEAYEMMAQCQFNNGDHQHSRQSLLMALDAGGQDALKCAQLQHQIGYSYEVVHQHQQALAHYALAQQHLRQVEKATLAQSDSDIELRLITSHINVYYWLNDQAKMARYLSDIQHLDMTQATAAQQALYYKAQIHPRFRQLRFNMDDEGVALAKAAFDAISQTDNLPQILEYRFSYAVILFSNGRLEDAQVHLDACIEQAQSFNNILLLARCLTYNTVLHRLADDVEKTEAAANQALESSNKAQMLDYSAAAEANLAWVAYKKQDLHQAHSHNHQALETWSRLSGLYAYPMQWLGLLLELAMQLNESTPNLTLCQSLCAQMLNDNQQRLPAVIEYQLEQLQRLNSSLSLKQQIAQVVSAAQSVSYL